MMRKVSVIIPCYNHDAYIEGCLLSVLKQTYTNLEIIVIDDGSMDSSLNLLKKLKENHNFILISQENKGVCEALNTGVNLSTGEYIALLGSDDIMFLDRIERQVSILDKRMDIDVLAGSVITVDSENNNIGKRIAKPFGYITFDQMIGRNRVIAPTVMIRKKLIDEVGCFDQRYIMEDYYYWLKLLNKKKKIFNSQELFTYYRKDIDFSEEKARQYYEGKKLALEDYLPKISVRFALGKNKVIYLLKIIMAGKKLDYIFSFEEYSELNFLYKVIIIIFGSFPKRFRIYLSKIAVGL